MQLTRMIILFITLTGSCLLPGCYPDAYRDEISFVDSLSVVQDAMNSMEELMNKLPPPVEKYMKINYRLYHNGEVEINDKTFKSIDLINRHDTLFDGFSQDDFKAFKNLISVLKRNYIPGVFKYPRTECYLFFYHDNEGLEFFYTRILHRVTCRPYLEPHYIDREEYDRKDDIILLGPKHNQ